MNKPAPIDPGQRLARCLIPVTFLLVAWTTAEGVICQKREIKLEDPYQYVSALIHSFSYVKYAMPPLEESKGEVIEKATDEMFRIKVANQHYQCAASMIEEYRKSTNEAISVSAQAAYLTYINVISAGLKAIREFENFIRVLASGKIGSFDHGALAKRITDIRLEADNAWELFVAAAIPAAAHALVHMPERAHERLSRLSITEAQRKTLLQDL